MPIFVRYIRIPNSKIGSEGIVMKTRTCAALAALLLSASYAAPFAASATTGTITAAVKLIKVQDMAVGNAFFTLASTTALGRCAKDDNATMFLFPDDARGQQMFSLVELALSQGKTITAYADDTDAVYCFAKYVVINNQ
jgi:hypothetical protein